MKYLISKSVLKDWDGYVVGYYVPENGVMVPVESDLEECMVADIRNDADMDTIKLKISEA